MKYDPLLEVIADYVCAPPEFSAASYRTAHQCLLDALGCALLARSQPACGRFLHAFEGLAAGPAAIVGGGRASVLEAAFANGALIRWLDYNDTWLAAEWGHPSDNLGALLALMQRAEFCVRDLLKAMIQCYEIQGVLALENSFNRRGIDHVILVELASAALATKLLGGGREEVCAALSHVFADAGCLRIYRHGSNTVQRKSWAAGDACMRALQLARLAQAGEPGMATILSDPEWGFEARRMAGDALTLARPLSDYVMQNILFKVAFPAEFHGQTACEAALALHWQLPADLSQLQRVEIETQRPAVAIIDKRETLANSADRDHCLQYMVAVCLLFGELTEQSYSDQFHTAHPQIDVLREKIRVRECERYTCDYYAADKRAIANSVQLFWADGSCSEKREVYYPLGHPRRRGEATPLLRQKFSRALASFYCQSQTAEIEQRLCDYEGLLQVPVSELMSLAGGAGRLNGTL